MSIIKTWSTGTLTFSVWVFAVTAALAQTAPSLPMELHSFEVPNFRVVPVPTGLANPFSFAFRSNGDILVTERYTGKLRLIRQGILQETDISGVPVVYGEIFRAGLMSIALHPEDDSIVYLSFTKPITVAGEPAQTVALVRARLQENSLIDVQEIFTAQGLDTAIAGSTLLFDSDNKLFMSVGGSYVYAGTGEYAQDPTLHYGKLLRLNDDGTPVADNPFVADRRYLPEVYSVGHRNQLGLAFHPETGELWASENGPQGGDEINIIKPGANYGWPLVSFSRQYRGDWVTDSTQRDGFENPEILFWPSIAISAIMFYTGDKFPEWQGNLFVGSMITGRIPGTGHLERIVFNSRGQEIRRESLLRELGQRLRDVQQGPDGLIYVLMDEENGSLLRLEPAI